MVVLIIDDQTSVVSGIISGVNWEKIKVTRILKAYNAYEAKSILESQLVDIMLCDIEMPAESGLSLFRWVKKKGLNVECIFLTAHADFIYAKEAIKLGGFDYILQPARYEDIEIAILRAEEKLIERRKQEEYSSYGKILYSKKDKLLDSILKDWYFGKKVELHSILEDFKRLDIYIEEKSKVYLVLLNIMRWDSMAKKLEVELIKASLENIIAELFKYYGQKVLFSELDNQNYIFIIHTDCDQLIDEEGLLRQLNFLIQRYKESFLCSISCYTGGALYPEEISNRAKQLVKMRENNVMLSSEVFILDKNIISKSEQYDIHNMKRWVKILVEGGTSTVREECCSYLNQLSSNGQLNAESLKRFYQSFLQMLFNAAEQLNLSIHKMFEDKEALEKSLNSYARIDDMYELINFAMDYFDKSINKNNDTRNQIDQIIQYIHNNVDKDIRRNDIAEIVFLNQDYLSKLFKKEVGTSLKEFIMLTKIKEAQALLKTTNLPISIIAAKVGYSNFSHFSQIYKRLLGVTPGEDRDN